jgi:hypothetical protein
VSRHVEAHVAVEDVAELVADDALQFVAGELFERAAGDGDDGVARGEAGGEGVERGLVVEHVDGGTGVPEAMAISSTTLRRRRSSGVGGAADRHGGRRRSRPRRCRRRGRFHFQREAMPTTARVAIGNAEEELGFPPGRHRGTACGRRMAENS